MRFIGFQIEVDGNVLYQGVQGVSADSPVADVWDVLGTVEFESTGNDSVDNDRERMRSKALAGEIVVRFGHGNFGNERTLSTLTLQSENGGESWFVFPADVARIETATGG